MAETGWQRKFEDPITLADGRLLVTLMDAGEYISRLPKKETDLPDWQVAMQALLLVSRGATAVPVWNASMLITMPPRFRRVLASGELDTEAIPFG